MNSKPLPWPQAKYGTQQGKQSKEEVIYESKNGDGITVLGGSPIILTNRMDIKTNNCLTIAKNVNSGEIQSSYNVTRVIGQQKYNTVFTALLSVINPELRVKGILALLTNQDIMEKINVSTQTDDSDTMLRGNEKQNISRKYIRKRKMDPYVVLDDTDIKVRKEDIKTEINSKLLESHHENANDIDLVMLLNSKNSTESKTDEQPTIDEDSALPFDNISLGNISNYSFQLAVFNELDNYIDNDNNYMENRNEYCLNLNNGEHLMLPMKPEDVLHLATPDNLKQLSAVDAMKLIQYQQYIDCSTCLERDEDNCLPIHNAIVNNDMVVLWRHCPILKSLHGSVDVEMDEELTPLHLALQLSNMAAASLLLRHGADVIRTDASERCSLHHATNQDPEAVELLEQHCQKNARAILSQEPDLWTEELASKTDEQLAVCLGNLLGSKFDVHGYTPLMLAARAGWNDTVSALLSLSPDSINQKSRVAGETALYLAVSSACLQTGNKGDKDKIPTNYINTVKVLMSKGADPKTENRSGVSANSILSTEYNYPELSLIVNSCRNVDLANLPKIQALTNCMLVRNKTGDIQLEQVTKPKHANNNELKTNVNKALNVVSKVNNDKYHKNNINKDNADKNKISNTIPNKSNSNIDKTDKIRINKTNVIIKHMQTPRKTPKYKIVSFNNSKLPKNAVVLIPQVKNKMADDAKTSNNTISDNNLVVNSKNKIQKPITDSIQNKQDKDNKRYYIIKDHNKSLKEPNVKIIANEIVKNMLGE